MREWDLNPRQRLIAADPLVDVKSIQCRGAWRQAISIHSNPLVARACGCSSFGSNSRASGPQSPLRIKKHERGTISSGLPLTRSGPVECMALGCRQFPNSGPIFTDV